MQQKIAQNPGFAACFSKNMLNWALAEGSQLMPTSCATQAVVADFNKGDKSLSSLLHAVAVSKAFTNRNAGANP
jgi:protein-disulfide isomerase-like protein with CxxC motif